MEKLSALDSIQLRELLQRQEKLLANKAFISKLPDKGQKIKVYHDKILGALEERHNVAESCNLLSALRLDNAEWRGIAKASRPDDCLDSDDDDDDPLAIIINDTSNASKKLILPKEEKKLITEEDVNIDGHTDYVCKITDKSKLIETRTFKPYKTLISDINDPSKEGSFKRGVKWEVTAATPPPSVHGPVKEIHIQESLALYKNQHEHLKELQLKNATDKLKEQSDKSKVYKHHTISDNKYREVEEVESDSDSSEKYTSDQEVHDDEPKEGGVVFTVFN